MLLLGYLPLRQWTMLIRPSRDIGEMAAEYMRDHFKSGGGMASRMLRTLAERKARRRISSPICSSTAALAEWLVDLGRRDARARHDDWVRFWSENAQTHWERSDQPRSAQTASPPLRALERNTGATG